MVESEKTGIFYVEPSMVDMIPIGSIKPYKRNAKKHPQEQIEQIINSINAFGMNDPIGVWGEENVIVEGHGRYLALREMGESGLVPVIHLDNLTDEQRKAYALAHNKLTMNTDFDFDALSLEMDELSDFFDMSDFGFETDDSGGIESDAGEEDRTGNMAEKYLVPPFSVIYCNRPDWLARKRAWVSKGLHSEIGRGGTYLQFKEQPRGKLPTRERERERENAPWRSRTTPD